MGIQGVRFRVEWGSIGGVESLQEFRIEWGFRVSVCVEREDGDGVEG